MMERKKDVRLDEIEGKPEGPWLVYTYGLRVHTYETKGNSGKRLCGGRMVTSKHGVSSDQTGHIRFQNTQDGGMAVTAGACALSRVLVCHVDVRGVGELRRRRTASPSFIKDAR